MDPELFDILSHSNKDIDNQKLMDYLSGKLSAQEKHEVEKIMAESNFMNDAIEGLQHIKDKKKLQAYIDQLNLDLKSHLQKKKLARENRRIKEYPWIYVAIAIILLLCFVGYIIIRKFLH